MHGQQNIKKNTICRLLIPHRSEVPVLLSQVCYKLTALGAYNRLCRVFPVLAPFAGHYCKTNIIQVDRGIQFSVVRGITNVQRVLRCAWPVLLYPSFIYHAQCTEIQKKLVVSAF